MKSSLKFFITVISAVLLFNSFNMLNSYWVASALPQALSADGQSLLGTQLTVSLVELIVGLILLILACFVIREKN
ncbi:Uncharacterised protein [uncultured archaeon]|nr:Uncharacterised protein [uncultured archaeon]